MNKRNIFSALALTLLFGAINASACSTVRLTAKDNSVMSARTMEFGYEVGYGFIAAPKGSKMFSPNPNGGEGLKWTSNYNYIGVSVFGKDDMVVDGMNEAGLSISGLWFESDTKWPQPEMKEYKKALAHVMFGVWALGTCKDVAEVKAKLAEVKMFGLNVPQMKMEPPLHYEVDDASGASIVVEAQDGELHVYDNPIGILTNAPNFPYMVTNLRNYLGMKNTVLEPDTYNGVLLRATGHGSGMFGIPGDLTPPSRFVRLAVQIHNVDQAADSKGLLSLAQHLDNTVDIVRGMAVDKNAQGEVVSSETTQWVAFKDLTNRVLYYRTYDNMNIRKIDLKTLDFSGGTAKKAAVYSDTEIITDVTTRFK